MNIQTINMIARIAGFAADRVRSGETLKSVKARLIADSCASTCGYSDIEAVDFDEVAECVWQMTDASTKNDFCRRGDLLVDSMADLRDAADFDKRVAHTIKIAQRDHNVTITAADVIEWANGNTLFNFTKAAAALAEAAAETTVTGLTLRVGQTIEGTDGRPMIIEQITGGAGYRVANGKAYGQYAHVCFDVTEGGRCARYGVVSVRLLADVVVTPELVEKHHDEALAFDAHLTACYLENASREGWTVWGEAKGVLAADQRRKALDAAHAEALDLDAARDVQTVELQNGEWVAAADGITKDHAAQVMFYAANDYAARRELVEAAHDEAQRVNVMVNIQRDVMAAPYLPALVEACHAEALILDAARIASTEARQGKPLTSETDRARIRLYQNIAFLADGMGERMLADQLPVRTTVGIWNDHMQELQVRARGFWIKPSEAITREKFMQVIHQIEAAARETVAILIERAHVEALAINKKL